MKHGLVTLVVIIILKYTASFQVSFVVSVFTRPTAHADQHGVHLLKMLNPPSAFVYFRWSCSCYSGLGLGLKNLVVYITEAHYYEIRSCRSIPFQGVAAFVHYASL